MEKLILGSKPMNELTDDELRAGIAQLQAQRQALVAEAGTRRARELTPKAPAPRKKKEPEQWQVDMLRMLKEE